MEVWAGLECTLNRVGDAQHDQLALSGHYDRLEDIERIAALGVSAVRYPVLWERFAHEAPTSERWRALDERMFRMLALGVEPIVGLVHHGSGPFNTNLLHEGFAEGLAAFARKVCIRYPWITRFTPVNEPLTTARFSALYGLWYPHVRDDARFVRATLNQVRAVRLAMEAIRTITPGAKLLQTEDLGRTHATPALQYQADFENERRWLTFDLLTNRVAHGHAMHEYVQWLGISDSDIAHATGDGCPPDLLGINHYVTSERWIDERLEHYPPHTHGGNGRHRYADVEAVRAMPEGAAGPASLLREAWSRYGLPLVVSEVHLGCTREQQLRWFHEVWNGAASARTEGADVRAVTAWAALGAHDWSSLVTRMDGHYEPGLFDIRAPAPRATALSSMVHSLAANGTFEHPVLDTPGWWRCAPRLSYRSDEVAVPAAEHDARPLLVVGASGTLGVAFARTCADRGLACCARSHRDLDITDRAAVSHALETCAAWAVVNTAGFVRVDDAEVQPRDCRRANALGAATLAAACADVGIPLMTFSSDLVFDGRKRTPYVETDHVSPLGTYGASKARAESRVMALLPSALVIRTSAFFGPWDEYNFLTQTLRSLQDGIPVQAAGDLVISPTYVPDLVNAALDLLIDGERGIWHLANDGAVSWAELARRVADRSHLDASLVCERSHQTLGYLAARPSYSVLGSERASVMPSLDDAIGRFLAQRSTFTHSLETCNA
ncbi:MAG: dTDP-4-dehydrorhamnose reductase [Gemmatimonadetes bacterium]|nr:dTDP-4-dehydrorhamnose reductase [Gemmatimonadota bacterium]